MRIVIIGSNGQVAAEVALLLASRPKVELRPLVRSRSGSAFLRYHGVPVQHGSVTDPEFAGNALAGADVVANFALAGGTPAAALAENEHIIRATFEHSAPAATIVFFSTLAIRGSFDDKGRRRRTAYGDLKLRNERLVARLAKSAGRKAYILRLGHVAGPHQGITALCREELMSPPVVLPDLKRLSNVIHTATIADALIAIGTGRAGEPGRYDLVNVPQWTWRQVYEKEAAELELVPRFHELAAPGVPRLRLFPRLQEMAFGAIKNLGLRNSLTRVIAILPSSSNEVLRAEYLVDRARSEIAALRQASSVRNPAVLWPALKVRTLRGLTRTEDLFAANAFPIGGVAVASWPADLGSEARAESFVRP
jgi:nucleoside-diphosphate-sugar epimerase